MIAFDFNKIKIDQYKLKDNLKAFKIFYNEILAGKILIKYENTDGISGWFLSIELNQKSRNKKIGKAAILKFLFTQLRCKIYANVRKTNVASIKILEYVGFNIFKKTKSGQLIYIYEPNKYNLDIFTNIRWEEFYPSVLIDILVFLGNPSKKSIRIPYKKCNFDFSGELKSFCKNNDFYYYLDNQYIIISKVNNASEIYAIDISPEEHTKSFGEILGYPECCINYISKYKEEDIDEVEKQLIEERRYDRIYKAIDFSGYLTGKALISHISCSTNCNSSLGVALLTALFIYNNTYQEEKIMYELNQFIDNNIKINVI